MRPLKAKHKKARVEKSDPGSGFTERHRWYEGRFLQATWTGTAGPVQVHSDSSDFYVEPQMCLILYIETDLHTVRMHEPSCLSPISMVEM